MRVKVTITGMLDLEAVDVTKLENNVGEEPGLAARVLIDYGTDIKVKVERPSKQDKKKAAKKAETTTREPKKPIEPNPPEA